ncbi:MAG: 50S ribosomal protein L16 [Nanoarchaeota archaeon]|nr:50S ribosomal protein L16 [Nanoarchaeota archaeon]MBU1632094.1 50S ribosomal protein L16 [Nanoarchaeota archaeon]MBU1875728.1 50S ribosomal protein L16 [Nanoarchaeota archaeon]
MAKLRKFAAYQKLERPYTRISKYTKQNYVRGGFPHMKVIKFDMGSPEKEYDTVIKLNVCKSMNIRHNALESARLVSNRFLEKSLGKNFHLRVRVYPFHVLRENPLASGAGADRMSTGMKKSYGKSISSAARMKEGQAVLELRINKEHFKIGKEALSRSAKKLPCSCKVVAN